jgi:hypothetical protein
MIGLAYEDLDSDIGFSSHRLPRAGEKIRRKRGSERKKQTKFWVSEGRKGI